MNLINTTSNENLNSQKHNSPSLTYKPVRQPGGKRKSPNRRVTYLNIPTLQEDFIICESNLERDCALILALNPNVVRIDCQPERICLGNRRNYTPDFRLIYKSGPPSIVEVKPTVLAYEKKAWAKICAASQHYKDIGIHYEWISDWEIQKKNRHLNAAYIHRCARVAISSQVSQNIIDVVSKNPHGISIDALKASTGVSLDEILYCVGHRLLQLNHYFEYQATSLVYPLQGECK